MCVEIQAWKPWGLTKQRYVANCQQVGAITLICRVHRIRVARSDRTVIHGVRRRLASEHPLPKFEITAIERHHFVDVGNAKLFGSVSIVPPDIRRFFPAFVDHTREEIRTFGNRCQRQAVCGFQVTPLWCRSRPQDPIADRVSATTRFT